MARVQYSRHFHKNGRRFSQIPDDYIQNRRQKRCCTNFLLPEEESTKDDSTNKRKITKDLSKNDDLQKIDSTLIKLRRSKRKQILNKTSQNNELLNTSISSNNSEQSNCAIKKLEDHYCPQIDKTNYDLNFEMNNFCTKTNQEKEAFTQILDDQNFSTIASDYLIVDGYFESGDGADMILADNCQEPLLSSVSPKIDSVINESYDINYFDDFCGRNSKEDKMFLTSDCYYNYEEVGLNFF